MTACLKRYQEMSRLTHLDEDGAARMVDVSEKSVTRREARAEAFITMQPETLELILSGGHKKGDVFAVARIAGIQAAKRCHELIPLCHPLMLTGIDVELEAVAAEPMAEKTVDDEKDGGGDDTGLFH